MLFRSLLFSVVLTCLSIVRSESNRKSLKVLSLNGKTFNDVVQKNERPFMIKFFAPWCGYCKSLAPEYEKLAVLLEGLVDVAELDCTQSDNQAVCSRYGVQGYPMMKLLTYNGQGNQKRVIDYTGKRSATDMAEFAKKNSHQFIFKVSNTYQGKKTKWNVDLATFFSKGDSLPKLVLFRADSKTPSGILTKALSIKYHYKVVVGEVSLADDQEIVKELGLESVKVNTIIYFPSGKQSPIVRFTEEIERKKLFAFVDAQLSKPQQASVVVKFTRVQSRKELNSICFNGSSEWCVLIVSKQEESDASIAPAVEGVQAITTWSNSFNIVQIEGSQGGSVLLESLNVSTDLPVVLAMNSKQGKYALMTQELSKSTFTTFIENALSDRVRFVSIKDKESFVSDSGSEKDEL